MSDTSYIEYHESIKNGRQTLWSRLRWPEMDENAFVGPEDARILTHLHFCDG